MEKEKIGRQGAFKLILAGLGGAALLLLPSCGGGEEENPFDAEVDTLLNDEEKAVAEGASRAYLRVFPWRGEIKYVSSQGVGATHPGQVGLNLKEIYCFNLRPEERGQRIRWQVLEQMSYACQGLPLDLSREPLHLDSTSQVNSIQGFTVLKYDKGVYGVVNNVIQRGVAAALATAVDPEYCARTEDSLPGALTFGIIQTCFSSPEYVARLVQTNRLLEFAGKVCKVKKPGADELIRVLDWYHQVEDGQMRYSQVMQEIVDMGGESK